MLYRSIVATLGAIGSASALAIPAPDVAERSEQCSAVSSGEILVYDIIIINEPVVINTWVPHPTVISASGATVTVTESDTQLSTTVTKTTTKTVTKTVSTASIKGSTVASSSTTKKTSSTVKPTTTSSSKKASSSSSKKTSSSSSKKASTSSSKKASTSSSKKTSSSSSKKASSSSSKLASTSSSKKTSSSSSKTSSSASKATSSSTKVSSSSTKKSSSTAKTSSSSKRASTSSGSSSSSTVSVNTDAAGTGLNTALYTATSTYPQSSTTVTTVVAASTSTGSSTTKVVSSTATTAVPASTTSLATGDWTDWTIFNANGANLGNWLEIEYSNNQYFWDTYVNGTAVTDEWDFCETLGSECGPVLEAHYETSVTTDTIDKLASVGVNFLRIPTTYAAWIDLPGSELYHGNQQKWLKAICEYAIGTYGMRVVVGLHSLPGGVNDLDIGEAAGHDGWFYNETNLEYSYKAVSAILDFVDDSSYPWAYTLSVLNEASDNIAGFATSTGLTSNGTTWIVDYTNGVFDLIADSNTPDLPVMLQDCFLGEEHWSPYFDTGANLVIDTHIYYFAASGIYSEWVNDAVCGQAEAAPGDGKFPVFIGEWSLQVLYNNSYDSRESIFNTQRYAWSHYVQGGSFWSANFNGTAAVDGEGTQRDYWSYTRLIDDGVIKSPTNATYC